MHGAMTVDDDKRVIRELVENWAVWRDARLWDQFRTVWHADGRMMATWFQGTFEEFIEANQEGWARGVRILHFLGGSAIEIVGARAIAQTKMTISQRRWGLVLRRLAYEKDRLDPVDPSANLALDQDLLKRFPEGYQHLAYLQTKIGYQVRTDMAGLEGPELDALYAQGARWLKGEAL
jgi:hypothetical protein